MRLEAHEVAAIKAAAAQAFGAGAIVRLFGSRADDTRKGGDIDLHVEVPADLDIFAAQGRFENSLFARIEPQKVDVIVRRSDRPMRGIDMIAHRDGIVL